MVRVYISEWGSKFWFLNDDWHRSNGPTIAWADGENRWYRYGREVTEFEHMMLSVQEQVDG